MGFLDLTRPEHAYLFGFLQCDGHLTENTRNRGRLSVELSIRDVALLERFQQLVPFPSSITTRTRSTNFKSSYTSAIWTVCALEVRRELIELGLPVGRKSWLVQPPPVPLSSVDYLRGLVDADGSVGSTRLGLPFVSFTTASESLRDFFLSECRDLPGQPRHVARNRRDAFFNPMATRECAVELARALYYEGCLALQRKATAANATKTWSRDPFGQLALPFGSARRGHRHARARLETQIRERVLALSKAVPTSPCS
jgi:LAGLIDADG-like domain